MNVWIAGATGLIGSAVTRQLRARGHVTVRLTRGVADAGEIGWNPRTGVSPGADLPPGDAVVHLAARSIGHGRITAAIKQQIRASRIDATHALCMSLAGLPKPPSVIVCASGIGYYGDQGDRVLDESAGLGSGFLAELVRDWEAACEPARQAGIRVVNLRIAPVLSRKAGLLKQMLPAFQFGVGGPIGNGRQYLPWCALEDTAAAFVFAIENEAATGALNVCSPNPVTMNEFARTLGRVLHRPALLRVPPLALRLLFGRVVEEMATDSIRAIPRRLTLAGFRFRDAELETAIRNAQREV
ncbi:TIGR01777 family protein [candidate division KSB1 bacterium]|nr:TIGR01777 family protein [candidate division KSB1 bacterium]